MINTVTAAQERLQEKREQQGGKWRKEKEEKEEEAERKGWERREERRGEEIGKDIKQFTCCSYCTRKRSCDSLLLIEILLIQPLFIEDQLKENNTVETANGNRLHV